MSIDRMRRLGRWPNFRLHELPEVERAEAGAIRSNIGSLSTRATDFWSAKALIENFAAPQLFDAHNQSIYQAWQLCAARDCAMSIYHFGKILEGIDESLGRCPDLRGLINTAKKREARKRFEREFPSYISMRHAISHSAERTKTAKDTERHGRTGMVEHVVNPEITVRTDSSSSFILLDNLYGSTFSSSWDGTIFRCDLSDRSGLELDAIVDEYWAAFDAVIDPDPEPLPTVTISDRPTPFT